jgi:uncharacterized protein YgiM (DUF1202 family)
MPTSLITGNTLLVLVGLILLAINLAWGLVQLQNERLRAEPLSVGLALIACVVMAIGFFRIAFVRDSQTDLIPPFVATAGGVLAIVVSLIIYGAERRKASFEPGHSLGLLNLGAGAFVVIAAVVIPLIPYQFAGMPVNASAQSIATSPVPTLDSTPASTATLAPSNTPTPQDTATPLPSLTPTVSETPIVLYTPIIYVSTYALTAQSNCTVVAKTYVFLRGDPSEKMAAIGTIFAGSLLNVTGRVANKLWWRVINNDGAAPVEGWVRADTVTADPACTDDAVVVVGPTATPTSVPTKVNATSAVTAGPCTLLTTNATSLRPDPSRQQVPLAQVPAGTVLTPVSKTSNGQWWHVKYGNQDGWLGAGAVIASATCSTVPTVTPNQ